MVLITSDLSNPQSNSDKLSRCSGSELGVMTQVLHNGLISFTVNESFIAVNIFPRPQWFGFSNNRQPIGMRQSVVGAALCWS